MGGGAIYNRITLTVDGATFANNHANTDGGAIHAFSGANTTILNSTFQDNTANGSGQAIFNDSTMSSQDSTYTNNTCVGTIADNGGNVADVASVGCPNTPVVVVTPPPAPEAPAVLVRGCALDAPSGVAIANVPDNTYCRLLTNASGAVPSDLVGLGVKIAVDVFRMSGGQSVVEFGTYARVCLNGTGRLFYLDARNAPRHYVELASERVGNATCGWIPAPGTLVLTD